LRVSDQSIIWRRLDPPGHEACRLSFRDSCWHLSGTAVFVHNQQACQLDYSVVCAADWQTRSGRVAGWVGTQPINIELAVDSARRWRLNGVECPSVANCIDLDLNFSPSTNLLPIRRLDLAIGAAAEIQVAWLRFPGFALEPLSQIYRRITDTGYRYESAGGRYVADLQVNATGFVIAYPHLWQIEGGA